MITEEKVNHIASLAHLSITKEEMEKYQQQLTDILTEIEKITSVEISEDNIMISSSDNQNCYKEDIIGTHISKEDAFKNAKHAKGDYIIVPKVVD